MKIVLIVYGISWLILMAVYIASLFNKRKNVFSEKEPWYLYAIIIAVAPLVVLLIPYLFDWFTNREWISNKIFYIR